MSVTIRLHKSQFPFTDLKLIGCLFTDFGYCKKEWKAHALDFLLEDDKEVTKFLLKYGGRVMPEDEQTVEFVGSLL